MLYRKTNYAIQNNSKLTITFDNANRFWGKTLRLLLTKVIGRMVTVTSLTKNKKIRMNH